MGTTTGRAIIWLTAALTAAGCTVTACSTAHRGPSSADSCSAALVYQGRTYGGTSLRTHAPYDRIGSVPRSHLRRIGTGTLPACHDTNGPGAADRSRRVGVARIDGVDPGIAIAQFPEGSVYLAPGAAPPATLTSAPWIRWRYSG